jgi:basic membrane protein A
VKIRLKGVLSAAMLALCTHAASAQNFLPALVFNGLKQDGGFNQLAQQGAERFKQEFGIDHVEAQGMNDAQYQQALRAVARRGATLVVVLGNPLAPWVTQVAREYPQVRFVLIDAVAHGNNVRSIRFRDQEGAFLVGMAAALKSQTHTIGFIGGRALPTVLAFGCGYVQGARLVDPNVRVIQNMVADTERGFNDPARGVELARSQFDRGVDVVFSAAMFTSLGVLQHARDAGKYSIGVDSNQNGRHPGSVLTSMVKRIDNVVYDTLKAGKLGVWQPGVSIQGLKEGAVDWTLDQHNRALISPAMEQRINAARDDIIAGRLKVVDYRSRNRCPVK